MQRVHAALLVLAIVLPAAAAGSSASDLGITLSLRRGLLSADKLLRAASNIFTGAVPKTDFQKVCSPLEEGNPRRVLVRLPGAYL